MRLSESSKRLSEMKSSGIQTQSAEQLLSKLQRDVRDLSDKKEALENNVSEREAHLSKLQGWEKSDRITTEDDVRAKREQVNIAFRNLVMKRPFNLLTCIRKYNIE